MKQKTKIYMGIPSTGSRVDIQMYALRALEDKYKDQIELVYPENFTKRMFHDFARNGIVEEFLQSECDILWFLDADVSPPQTILDLVTEHGDKWKVAGATYPVWMVPPGHKENSVVFTCYRKYGDSLIKAEVPKQGQEFVDGLATGCLFIKRELLEQLQEPYFEFKYDSKTMEMTEGEDLGFCHKVNKLGYKFFTDFSMVCRHYKTVDLLDINNYAIEYANNAVLAYDRAIRPKVQRLETELREKMRSQPSAKKSKLILP